MGLQGAQGEVVAYDCHRCIEGLQVLVGNLRDILLLGVELGATDASQTLHQTL